MAIDADQLHSIAKDTIVAMSRASIPHVMVLIIDRRLGSMNGLPLSV